MKTRLHGANRDREKWICVQKDAQEAQKIRKFKNAERNKHF